MSHTQVQWGRGPTAAIASYAGPPGEIVVNTDDFTLHVQDGSTPGGHQVGALDGNNYAFVQPASGATLTAPAFLGAYVLDPAGTLAALTIVLPPTANDGQVFEVSTTQAVTALTVGPAAGQSVRGGSVMLTAGGGVSWRYRGADSTWYRRY